MMACMFAHSENHPPLKTRKLTAEEINHALTRFPLVVQVLGELRKAEFPHAGDEDIRHGCERALTSMLVELARIEPAPPGKTSKAEESALGLFHSKAAALLVNTEQLQRIQQFIERILGPQPNPH